MSNEHRQPLIAITGIVERKIQLTETGFSKILLSNGQIVMGGEETAAMREDQEVLVIGRREVKPKYGPQVKLLRWWPMAGCPFSSEEAARKSIAFLYDDLKLPQRTAEKILDAYLERTKKIILANPYQIVTDGFVSRVSVKTIDQYIAPTLNISPTDRRRLKAQILSTIKRSRNLDGIPLYEHEDGTIYGSPGGGHVYADFTQLVGYSAEEMNLDPKIVAEEMREMARNPRNPYDERPLIAIEKDIDGKDRYVYVHALHVAERGIAFHARRISHFPPHERAATAEIRCSKVHLSVEQRDAVEMALKNKLSIITGGPGVGKTTIIGAITETLTSKTISFALCAPTGIASRRMAQATEEPASTIHRLLAVDPRRGKFRHDHENPLQADYIICDECSMVDEGLMYSLLDAVKDGAHLLLVGDADQLPPVGPGAPFRDLIRSKKFRVTRLTEIRRQELSDSLIIHGSRTILAKQVPKFCPDPRQGKDLYKFEYKNDQQALKHVVELVTTKIEQVFGISMNEIQVLSPHRRRNPRKNKEGEITSEKILSTEAINEVLQEKIHGSRPPEKQRFLVGDRVVHTKNDYNLEVMNGEIGHVADIKIKRHKEVEKFEYLVHFEDKDISYTQEEASHLQLAYALSIHKYQGSEANAIVLLAYDSGRFYNRSMLYTALTRGKKIVVVVTPTGDKGLKHILRTEETSRNSRLCWRLEKPNESDVDEFGAISLDELDDTGEWS